MTLHNPDLLLSRPRFNWDRFAHEHDAEAARIEREYYEFNHGDFVGNVTVARSVQEVLEANALWRAELEIWRRRKGEEFLDGIGGHRDQ